MSTTAPNSSDRMPIISAHELAEYGFCARAWWLKRVVGAPSANAAELERGAATHRAFGRQRLAARVLQWLGAALLIGGLILLIAYAL